MSTRIPSRYDELVESEDFQALEGGEYAERTGVIDNSVIKILSESQRGIITVFSRLDPSERGFSIEDRVDRVREFSEDQDGRLYNAPELIGYDSAGALEVEFLDSAEDFIEFVKHEEPEAVRDVSREVGEALKDMHSNGWAYRDFNYGNLMVEDNSFDNGFEVYFTDPEFVKKDPKPQDKAFDIAAFSYTYGTLGDVSEEVMSGFRDGYGLSDREANLAMLSGSAKSLIVDRDISRALNGLKNM
ncbi:hypothetical protein [Candidatus Nanohalovita haloferacivicina]|uniref:hypothetical protein n=1 Tax=Candidatus Nanohalovita haloferacivicina TaxID=2978046 RepID=UPI00325FAED1|nr:hypothetical protein HBNXNv_1041 [Candidatus Nanohalobia archaeon BNXNv]